MRTTSRLFGALVLSSTLPLLAGALPAGASSTSIALDCKAETPIGDQFVTTSSAAVSAAAPKAVPQGTTYTERLTPPPLPIPDTVGGYPLIDVHDVTLRFRVGAAATIVGVQLVGGRSPGATASVTGHIVTVVAPSAVPGGGAIELPDAVVVLQAIGPRQVNVVTDVPGTSYADWTTKLTARVRAFGGDHDLPTSCFARPVGAVLSRTLIV